MSVTAEVETCYRTNVLAVPFASVTTRPPKQKDKKAGAKLTARANSPNTNSTKSATNTATTTVSASATATDGTNVIKSDKKAKEALKQVEVVFLMEGERAKMIPVKIGISDDSYWEITDGLREGQEVVSGGFKAITRELEDGSRIRKGLAIGSKAREPEKKD
jgi:HlyD family secretion protein